MLISKIIGGWIQQPDVQMVFKFHVNQMKIEDFRIIWFKFGPNLAQIDILAYVDLKINRWLNLATWCANGLQI